MPLEDIMSNYVNNDNERLDVINLKRYLLTAVSRGQKFVHFYAGDNYANKDSAQTENIEKTSLTPEQAAQNKIEQYNKQLEIMAPLIEQDSKTKQQQKPSTGQQPPTGQGTQGTGNQLNIVAQGSQGYFNKKLINQFLKDWTEQGFDDAYKNSSAEVRSFVDSVSREDLRKLKRQYDFDRLRSKFHDLSNFDINLLADNYL